MSPWSELPYSLVTLYEMQQFAAYHFVEVTSLLARAETLLHALGARLVINHLAFQFECKAQVDEVQEILGKLKMECNLLELSTTTCVIDDLNRRLRCLDMQALGLGIREVRRVLHFELQTKTFMYIPQEKIRYFKESRALFGNATLDKFPSVISEVEEAGKCYAAGRNTAAVFHLLRVMEAGLKAIAKELSIPDTNPSWDSILRKVKSSAEAQHPSDEWTSFYTDLIGRLYAVKDAWRNPTMHIEKVYGSEEALDIFNVVASFMRHLAARLSE